MKEAKFKIGDRVQSIFEHTVFEVMDAFYSIRSNKWFYEVRNNKEMTDCTYSEENLVLAPEKKDYSMDIKIDIANNVVIATLYESVGGVQKPLRKGHGHLIHEGDVGIAQAASYACYRLYQSMGGNER